VRRHRLHSGQEVFINTLKATKEYIGINDEMKSLIGTYINIHRFAHSYNECIVVRHPKSYERYTIHCKDISLEPVLTGRTETFKVEKEIKGRFDVETLYV